MYGTKEQWEGLVRHVLTMVGPLVIAKGIDEGSWLVLVGAITSVAGVAWSWLVKPKPEPQP